MNTDNSPSTSNWSLPFNRGFVIQVEAQSDVMLKSFRGRVEHMASGQAIHFHCQEELLSFITSILKDGTNKKNE